MTFSLLGHCARTGRFGIAVTSSSPAVAARCAFARAGVGAAATQNVTDPRLGPALLDELAAGADPSSALARVNERADNIDFRQLTVLDGSGTGAAYDGARALGNNGHRIGAGSVAAGNLLAQTEVLAAVIAAFEADPADDLGARLLAGLAAGVDAGGEAGPLHSAGLLVVADVPWPVTDLRVDWCDEPVARLAEIWAVWRPQVDDYVTRALAPDTAPGYGVPGEAPSS